MSMAVAWSRSDQDPRPVADRWHDTAKLLRSRGGDPNGFLPMSESTLYAMRQELQRLAPAPVVCDEAWRAASQALSEMQSRYRTAASGIETAQRRLETSHNAPIHRLLKDLPVGWNKLVPREPPKDPTDCNSSAQDFRVETTRLIPDVLALEELRNKLELAIDANKLVSAEKMVWTSATSSSSSPWLALAWLSMDPLQLRLIAGEITS
jgi:hypothetical protein